ncbi:unnamed protein product [Meloidogyne enterolobii]|uniref:Uncharacterized protein n=1 Tax=Meloidogyne enterolobii TaxID=390850 RepID=A0ACB1AY80_MELEN
MNSQILEFTISKKFTHSLNAKSKKQYPRHPWTSPCINLSLPLSLKSHSHSDPSQDLSQSDLSQGLSLSHSDPSQGLFLNLSLPLSLRSLSHTDTSQDLSLIASLIQIPLRVSLGASRRNCFILFSLVPSLHKFKVFDQIFIILSFNPVLTKNNLLLRLLNV